MEGSKNEHGKEKKVVEGGGGSEEKKGPFEGCIAGMGHDKGKTTGGMEVTLGDD